MPSSVYVISPEKWYGLYCVKRCRGKTIADRVKQTEYDRDAHKPLSYWRREVDALYSKVVVLATMDGLPMTDGSLAVIELDQLPVLHRHLIDLVYDEWWELPYNHNMKARDEDVWISAQNRDFILAD